jgi:hypothetical protein
MTNVSAKKYGIFQMVLLKNYKQLFATLVNIIWKLDYLAFHEKFGSDNSNSFYDI